MTLRPFSATLQQNFRTTLGTVGAPEAIDDSIPVQAVAVVASNGPISPLGSQVVQPERSTLLSATVQTTGATATTNFGTVPAGKIWRIVGLSISTFTQIVGNGQSRQEFQLNGVAYHIHGMQSGGLSYGNFTSTNAIVFPVGVYPVLTAAQVARLVVTLVSGLDPGGIYATMWYIEESA